MQTKMSKWIVAVLAIFALCCVAQASLINLTGYFDDESNSFTYDGKLFENGWAIWLYQTSSSTVDFSISKIGDASQVAASSVNVGSDYVLISSRANLSFDNGSFVYAVLFDVAAPTTSGGSYLLLDTVARNVGAYEYIAGNYTPGNAIDAGDGSVVFAGQQWQPIPEPATMSLLGLGALALAFRRKIRK